MKNEKRYVIVFDVKMVLCNNTRKVGSKLKKGIKTLAKKDKEKADQVADEIIKNTYRTLMTRGMKGCYVYCTDTALAQYFKKLLKQK